MALYHIMAYNWASCSKRAYCYDQKTAILVIDSDKFHYLFESWKMCNVPSDKTRDGIADMGCTKEGYNWHIFLKKNY